jgi:hypothetical protein
MFSREVCERAKIMVIEITNDVARRVRRGVNFLDVRMPTWRFRISRADFDMGKWNYCVLGQLFGDYAPGREELELNESEAEWYGFNITDEEINNGDAWLARAILTEAWKAELHQEEVSRG